MIVSLSLACPEKDEESKAFDELRLTTFFYD